MESLQPLIIPGAILLFALVLLAVIIKLMASLRTVVETNVVHIVQSKKVSTSYGFGQPAGNVYYFWPSWIPVLGVQRKVLPISNFELPIDNYLAYDKDRVPFKLDVVSFFRIADTNEAAARISSFDELKTQLRAVLQGAVRTILAKHDIHQIMTERAAFGDAFTKEVADGLKSWGVAPVKNMELMDIRDEEGHETIRQIQAMKMSEISAESRKRVAASNQAAQTAEIEATRQIALANQQQLQVVGERTAETEREVGLAKQRADQAVQAEVAKTAEAQMAVQRVNTLKQAEIARDAAVIAAEQAAKVAEKEAEGRLNAKKKDAEGVRATGEAEGAAEQARLMAPVQAQIALAEKIAALPEYQQYLVSLKALEAYLAVGQAQASALQQADVKIIANTGGSASEGAANAMELFTPKGGLAIGGMLEALKNTPQGSALLNAIDKSLGGNAQVSASNGTKNGANGSVVAHDTNS